MKQAFTCTKEGKRATKLQNKTKTHPKSERKKI